MNKNMIPYKKAIKRIMKSCNVTEKQLQIMMEKGEIKVNAKHPESGMILPYRIKKIHEDGSIEGYFLQ